MIYRYCPTHGQSNPMVYISICSLVGSLSIMAIKALGIALKLTMKGNNQMNHVSTYVFLVITGACIAVQMNYFNKALSEFSQSM